MLAPSTSSLPAGAVIPKLGSVGFQAITDGLSNTLLVGESAAGPINNGAPMTRVSECYGASLVDGAANTTDLSLPALCSTLNWQNTNAIASLNGLPWRYKGYSFLDGVMGRTWFNTLLTPNKLCCAFSGGNMTAALKPLSSYHPGGVHAALADGSVRYFKDTVSNPVWTGLGTRAGGEVTSADSY